MQRFLAVRGVIAIVIITNIETAIIRPPARLSQVDWTNYNYHEPNGFGTYAFGYDIEDPPTDNSQFRNEERYANGTITGSYGYIDPDGIVRIFDYVADNFGYRVKQQKNIKLTIKRSNH